jgi:hypothetical protein
MWWCQVPEVTLGQFDENDRLFGQISARKQSAVKASHARSSSQKHFKPPLPREAPRPVYEKLRNA